MNKRGVSCGNDLVGHQPSGTTTNLVRSYVWGLDLSGSEQGAGGVGGSLFIGNRSSVIGHYAAAYDGNGNVMALVDMAGAGLAAAYEYGPFGELIRSTGAMSESNPFRFSTKYQDEETGLLYYGYRYYQPVTGRWINRDPIGEKDGLNLLMFCANDPLLWIDRLGEDITKAQCEAAKQTALTQNAVVKDIIAALREKKCPIPKVECRECCNGEDYLGAYFRASQTCVICWNKLGREESAIQTIAHELVHAYDDCVGGDIKDCEDRACREVRAADLSRNCDYGGVFYQSGESYRACVKRVAALATGYDRRCGDGTTAVNNVFNRCFSGLGVFLP
jgi:RHS repeat-associated protein